MKAISLFSGMGGDTLGLTQANVTVVAYSEANKTCQLCQDICTHLQVSSAAVHHTTMQARVHSTRNLHRDEQSRASRACNTGHTPYDSLQHFNFNVQHTQLHIPGQCRSSNAHLETAGEHSAADN